jgi:hypothetical protein
MGSKADRKPIAELWYRDAVAARIETHGSEEDAGRALFAELKAGLPYTYLRADGERVVGDPRFWHELFVHIEPSKNRAILYDPIAPLASDPPSDLPSEMREIKVAVAMPAPEPPGTKPAPGAKPKRPRGRRQHWFWPWVENRIFDLLSQHGLNSRKIPNQAALEEEAKRFMQRPPKVLENQPSGEWEASEGVVRTHVAEMIEYFEQRGR